MPFRILGEITQIEVIAQGRGVRSRARLNKLFGIGRWRKLKGIATVELKSGGIRRAEIHWYEAHGIGSKGHKIKRFVD
ncbi:MAG: hypothetical protein C0483_15480 [Pirellula sp.]|nr:hypothetical protein [Pirellula sp.]